MCQQNFPENKIILIYLFKEHRFLLHTLYSLILRARDYDTHSIIDHNILTNPLKHNNIIILIILLSRSNQVPIVKFIFIFLRTTSIEPM